MMQDSGANMFVPGAEVGATHAIADQNPATANDVDHRSSDTTDVLNKIPGFPKIAEAVSNVDMAQVTAKVDQLKKWTIGTFKNSKQQILEQMGKIDKTIDEEFEQECENLKEIHRRYGAVVAASNQFTQLLQQLAAAEKTLAESLYQLSLKECSIKTQCSTTSETMRRVGDQATSLESCLRYFLSTMETLHGKTIADTLDTIFTTEAARIEFDVHRHELASLQSQATASPTAIQDAQLKADEHKEKYDRLKADVRVKLRLLEENRVGVMSKQLEKLQSAMAAYYSGNAQLLQASIAELAAISPPQYQSFLLQ